MDILDKIHMEFKIKTYTLEKLSNY